MIRLTEGEQEHVRRALRFLRFQAGGWVTLAPALGFKRKTLKNVSEGDGASPNMAFRVARLAGVTFEEVISGKWPPAGACPHCGRVPPTQRP